jgi:hypothetical protein
MVGEPVTCCFERVLDGEGDERVPSGESFAVEENALSVLGRESSRAIGDGPAQTIQPREEAVKAKPKGVYEWTKACVLRIRHVGPP